MAIGDTHGVIVVYHSEGKSGPCDIHRPNGCEIVRRAMKSKTWERYPSWRAALELGFVSCMFCFGTPSPE